MAQRVVLTDDFDGSKATETVQFALDRNHYEVDVNDEHAAELRDFLEHYISVGRRSGESSRRQVTPGARAPRLHHVETEVSARAVREWAASRGITVSPRGRIPASVVQQFRAAGN